VSGRHRTQKSVVDNVYYFHFYKCQYDNCVTPPDPCTVPPAPTRPLNYDYWHEELIWELKEDGYVTNDVVTGTQVPQDYDNVRILIRKCFDKYIWENLKKALNERQTCFVTFVLFNDIRVTAFLYP
jgi:hypothetical protein